jgi:hypothetical protein
MIGLSGEELLKNCGGLFAVGEALVVVRLGGEQRERVERGGLVIVGIGLVDLLHRVGIGFSAGGVVELLRVGVERYDGGDVGLLARGGLLGQLPGRVHFVQPARNDLGIRLVPQLMPDAHGDSPMRHGAVRIVFGDLHEFLFGFLVPERVQQCDAVGEGLLHGRRAGDREVDRSELRLGEIFVMLVVVIVVGKGAECDEGDE